LKDSGSGISRLALVGLLTTVAASMLDSGLMACAAGLGSSITSMVLCLTVYGSTTSKTGMAQKRLQMALSMRATGDMG
jgi:hypothetical protein